MNVKKDHGCDRPDDHKRACQPFDAANAIEGSAQVAVAIGILVAMAAQSLSNDRHLLSLALRMQLITDVATASATGKLIDEVRSS